MKIYDIFLEYTFIFCYFRYFSSFFSFPVSVSKDVSEKMQQHKKYMWAKALMEERLSDLIMDGVNIQTHDITDRVPGKNKVKLFHRGYTLHSVNTQNYDIEREGVNTLGCMGYPREGDAQKLISWK